MKKSRAFIRLTLALLAFAMLPIGNVYAASSEVKAYGAQSAAQQISEEIGIMGSRTGVEPNCLTAITFRVFRRAFTRKVNTLLRKIPPKSIKN